MELTQYLELKGRAETLVRERIQGTRKSLPDEPNYLHSFRVRDLVISCHHCDDCDDDLFLAALLHDVVEDGGVSFQELRDMGFTDRTIHFVALGTHPLDIENSTERWMLMTAKLIEADDEDAWRIKLADLTDNLRQSKGLSPEARRFMIEVKAPLFLRLTEKYCRGYFGSCHYFLEQEMKAQWASFVLNESEQNRSS